MPEIKKGIGDGKSMGVTRKGQHGRQYFRMKYLGGTSGCSEGAELVPGSAPPRVRITVIWELNTNMTPFYHHWQMRFDNLVYDYICLLFF